MQNCKMDVLCSTESQGNIYQLAEHRSVTMCRSATMCRGEIDRERDRQTNQKENIDSFGCGSKSLRIAAGMQGDSCRLLVTDLLFIIIIFYYFTFITRTMQKQHNRSWCSPINKRCSTTQEHLNLSF